MNRDFLVYLSIFLVTTIVVIAILFISYINKPEKIQASDSLYVTPDSLFFDDWDDFEDDYQEYQVEPEDQRPSFINRRNVEVQLTEQEKLFLDLRERIQALHGILVEPEEQPEEIEEEKEPEIPLIDIIRAQLDSTRIVMQIQNDSLKVLIQKLITDHNAETDSLITEINRGLRENQTLRRTISVREQSNLDLRNQLSALNNTITSLRNEIHRLNNPIIEPVVEFDYKRLANVYNNMDPKKVGQLLQTMTPEQAVNVLKNMNQRKRAAVMSSLPNNVASKYSEILLEKR